MVSYEFASETIEDVGFFIRQQYEATQAKLGMDLITERKLLEG